MGELISLSLSFPTVIFTVALGVALGFWSLVFLGALGLDVMDGDGGDTDLDLDMDLADGPVAFAFFRMGRLRQIPAAVGFSLVSLFGWTSCVFGTRHLLPLLEGALGPNFAAWGILVLALLMAMPIANVVAVPLAPLFRTHEAPTRLSLIGKTVEVSTGEVNRKFGQARLEDGGAGLVLQIRCAPGRALARGQKAMIIEHDDAGEFYEVEPLDSILEDPSS